MQHPSPPPGYVTPIPLFEELRGERVLVRPYCEEDAVALFEAVAESREHLRRFLAGERFHLEGRLRNQMPSTDTPFADRLIFALTPADQR